VQDYESAIIKDIDYIIDKISRKAQVVTHSDAIQIIIEAPSLLECRKSLIKFATKNVKINLNKTQKNFNKKNSSMSNNRAKSPGSKIGATDMQSMVAGYLKVPTSFNECLGKGKTILRENPRTQCIKITFEDFCKQISFRYQEQISSLVADILHQFTGGALNLQMFETELSKFRFANQGEFNGTLCIKAKAETYFKKGPHKHNRESMKRTGGIPIPTNEQLEMDPKNENKIKRKHHVCHAFNITNSVNNSKEFNGKILRRPKKNMKEGGKKKEDGREDSKRDLLSRNSSIMEIDEP